MNEIGELRVISDHVLGTARVQIPQNNLDNLQSIREEEDGATKVKDPRDVPGSILLVVIDFATLGLLLGTDLGFDPLALVEGFTPVEDNRGLLVTLGMLPDDNTTTRKSSLSALENMHYSQMIRFDNAEEARKLPSKIDKLKQSS
ncbi:hypothetical protein Tco_1290031, partial [Tanacetum coccineum]